MKHSRKLLALLFCSFSFLGQLGAQSYALSNDIPVQVNGQNLHAAWAGGLNSPQFSSIDLDNNGVNDLLVFDRYDDQVLPFINHGTANQVDYQYAPEYMSAFPPGLQEWVLLRDFDGDGYQDIFTAVAQSSNIRVYRNTSNGGNLSFSLAKDTLTSLLPPLRYLYVPRSDLPSIEDIDGDGDLDILTFDTGGSFVEWHRNTSMETQGNLNGLEYELASLCFGHFRENSGGCNATVNQLPCAVGHLQGPNGQEILKPLHAGSTLLALDLNGDTQTDLLVGDNSCSTLYAVYGSDTSQLTHFDSLEEQFPSYDVSVDINTFPSIFFLDVNNDGVKDLVTAPNQTGNVEDYDGVWLHQNQGTNNQTDFSFVQKGFLQDEMIETGSGTSPVFFDYNGDNLLDLLVGNLGRFDPVTGAFIPSLYLFKNTGTISSPAYELIDPDYLNISTHSNFLGESYLAPSMGDLDGDGDVDLLLGSKSGKMYYFRNDELSGLANFIYVTDNFFGINADIFTAPCLYDLDSDNDLDLLIGNIRGDIHYFENSGTVTSPNFTFVTDSLGDIEITDLTGQGFTNGFARPFVVDYDFDGDPEILVGTVEGEVELYDNVSTNPGAVFSYQGALWGFDFGNYSAPTATVLDSSGALTYVMGNYRGGLHLLRYTGITGQSGALVQDHGSLKLFPNPATGLVNLQIEDYHGSHLFDAEIIDLYGRTLKKKPFSGRNTSLSLDGLSNGVYWVKVSAKGKNWVQKLMVKP